MYRCLVRRGSRMLWIAPSVVSTVGRSLEKALAETSNGLFKVKVLMPRSGWSNLKQVEGAVLHVGAQVKLPVRARIDDVSNHLRKLATVASTHRGLATLVLHK